MLFSHAHQIQVLYKYFATMQEGATLWNQQKRPNHEHGPLLDMDLDQRSRHECCLMRNSKPLKQTQKEVQSPCPEGKVRFHQFFDDVLEVLSANQHEVDQTEARAKNRPDSGVTVIEVPKTADTCSEVIT